MAKILIADDDLEVQEFIKMVLSTGGYETATASDGREALRKILEDKPDLVLMDIMMPILDGYKVCRILSEDPKYFPPPKVIILTSRVEETDRKLSVMVGADDFMNKPFKPEDLVAKVREVLQEG